MKLIINTIGNFKNSIILLAILIEIGWLGLTIKINLDSNTVQTEAISVLARSTLIESNLFPKFKKDAEEDNIYFWPGSGNFFSIEKNNISSRFQNHLLEEYGEEYSNLPSKEFNHLVENVLVQIESAATFVSQTNSSIPKDNFNLSQKFDNAIYTKLSKNLFILRYDWMGYSKNLYTLILPERNGVKIYIASVSDAAEKVNFVKSIIIPLLLLVISSLLLILLNYKNYLIKGQLESVIDQRTKDLLAAKKTIDDSVKYASSIQQSLLPTGDNHEKFFRDYYIFWQPKDSLGGDIYWNFSDEENFYFAIIDCTGHGIPGSLVSMITVTMFNSIINQRTKGSIDLSKVLSEINNNFVNTQKNNKYKISNEGFDGLIFKLNKNNKSLNFVSAKTPLFIKRKNGKVDEYNGTRKTVGYKRDVVFQQKTVDLFKDDIIILTTDGIFDQNNSANKIYSKKRMISTIEEGGLNTNFLVQYILDDLEKFKGHKTQRDDITIVAFQV